MKRDLVDDLSDLSSGDSSVGTPNPRSIEREIFDLRLENDQLKEKLQMQEVVIAENKRVIQSLGNLFFKVCRLNFVQLKRGIIKHSARTR